MIYYKIDMKSSQERVIPRVEKNDRVTPVKFDLHESVAEMTEAIKGADAVCFTAGSGAKDLLQVDAFGAVKLMQAAEKDGIKRFVMLSALFSLEPTKWRNVKGLDGLTDTISLSSLLTTTWFITLFWITRFCNQR